MTKTELTQEDVYTPAEISAFVTGFEAAKTAQLTETTPVADEGYTDKERAAFAEGVKTGTPTFNETAYQRP